jgi:hypothetical protein
MIRPIRQKWNSRMSDRERFNNQMHYLDIDRSFNMEFGYWAQNFDLWPLFKENNIKNNTEADIFFNFDRIECISGSVWLNPSFPQTIVDETSKNYIQMNSDGLLAEVPKDKHDTIPHYLKSSVVTPEDWNKVKTERFRRDDKDRIVDIDKLLSLHKNDRDYPLGVHCGSMIGKIRDMLTFEGLAYAVYDYPEMVEDMVETCCVLVEDFLDQVLPHFDFDYASGWEDIAFKNGPIVSVEFFRDIVMPRYKRISKKLHAAGIDLWYTDCDGDVRPILPYMMEGGINCLFPFEVNGCSHPAELLEAYGKDLRIMGGFDKIKMKEGKEAIKSYMKSLEPLVKRGGYIPFCDHRCPPDVTPENYLFYLDLKEKTFGI